MLQTINNNLIKKVLLGVFLLTGMILIGANQSYAQSTIAGEWDASMNTPGGARTFKIVFKVDGEKLTGTVKRASGDVPLEGTIKGNDLQFSYVIRYNENDLTMSMTGKLEGDTIKGTIFFGESGQSDEWAAKRAAAPKSKTE